jgi:hypothetical protein
MKLPCPWCNQGDNGDHDSSCPESGKLRSEETGLPEYARKKKRNEHTTEAPADGSTQGE